MFRRLVFTFGKVREEEISGVKFKDAYGKADGKGRVNDIWEIAEHYWMSGNDTSKDLSLKK